MADIVLNTVTHAIYGIDTGAAAPAPPDPAGVLAADDYLDARLGAATWATTSPDDQKRALITARSYLDNLTWKGTKTSLTQPLAWPHTGVTLSDGTVVADDTYPVPIVHAEYELAFQLVLNPTLLTDTAQGGAGNVKRVKAGTAEVEFFKSTPLSVLPQPLLMAIKGYLDVGTGGLGLTIVSGVTDESIFDPFRSYDIHGA